MDFPIYLAMTAAELARCETAVPHVAWMACHFSAYGTGLSNYPSDLPENSLIILNDRTPIHGHDPQLVAQQLSAVIEQTKAAGLLIDFQRPVTEEAIAVIGILQDLSCPVAVTQDYAKDCDCAVFLSPVPLHKKLSDHLCPWEGRKIWLELAWEQELLKLTKEGCHTSIFSENTFPETSFREDALNCHYHTRVFDDKAEFTLFRTAEDMHALVRQAQSLGVCKAVGLYQELHSLFYLST